MRIGYGITGSLGLDVVRAIAPELERVGVSTLWVNQPGRRGDALAAMAAAAAETTSLRVASGVIPVDLYPARELAARVRELGLPGDRTTIGIGASAKPSPLTTAGEAAARLRADLGMPVVIGALGPRMRRLGVTEADGVLLNWLTPDAARDARADRDADDPDGRTQLALYVRTGLPAGHARLREEAERYGEIPTYAANFARYGYAPVDAAILAERPADIPPRLRAYDGIVHEVVVRGITAGDELAEHLSLIRALA
ncbi:LLM class flavin-dependent oxidoreductase [Microbacterium sp. Marseille-Q6965]|uniref:LLM class flavin-dependent oxidoreductase n=1 Tax=Microbacterium sp. Marseille-Q6965 TaxID=2965072 RepID=UPI0021B7C186|nr:N5,N10-methylene tetrahydromethanopterin reductase [Microbacterium sp. Marseille-Q6965]